MDKRDFEIENGRLTRYTGDKTEVVIPEEVREIAYYAFHFNERITSVSIGKDVIIEDAAFDGCKGLADKDGFVIVNDVLYDYYGEESVVVIPDNVVCISKYAFAQHDYIKRIAVHKDVIIRDKAVWDCPGLVDKNGFVIINGVLLVVSAKNARKRELIIPDNVTCIAKEAFRDARNYGKYNCVYIPASVKDIHSSKDDRDGGIPAYEIKGEKGSFAEKFAKKTGKVFKSSDGNHVVDYSKINRSADEIEDFVYYMYSHAYEEFYLSGYLTIIPQENVNLEALRDDFVRRSKQFSARYMNNIYKYYPENEYDYEAEPGLMFDNCFIYKNHIRFELGTYGYCVYGIGIPDFRDYAILFFKWLNGYSKRNNLKYEGMIIDGQDFGCMDENWCTLDTNIDNNRFDMARRRINKALKPVLKYDDYSEYWDDINDFLSNNWWK